MIFPLTLKVTGAIQPEIQANIKRFGCPCIGSYALEREPDNPSDPNAIRVAIAKYLVGYIPADIAKELAPLMDAGNHFFAEFIKLNISPGHETVGLTISVVESNNPKG
jgi:hypothetical protein